MKEKLNNLREAYRAKRAVFIKKTEAPVRVLKTIFGYGILVSFIVGGLTFLGFLAAFCIGGDIAADICAVIKKYIIPGITYVSTVSVLFGILIMYLSGEVALSAKKKSKTDPNDKTEKA